MSYEVLEWGGGALAFTVSSHPSTSLDDQHMPCLTLSCHKLFVLLPKMEVNLN